MTHDSYCAICASCIEHFDVGSKSEKGQRVRSKVLRNRRRRASEPEESVSESDEDDDDLCEDEHSYKLSLSYDPDILEGHDTSWTEEILLVANDPRKRRAPRTFLCGLAIMEHGGFGMCRGTYDEHLYGTEDYGCQKLPLWQDDGYANGWSAGLGNFPCHVPCLKMLARAITGNEDFHQLDIYSLHRAMVRLNRGGGGTLNVDYGDKSEAGQTWESHPGEEVRRTWLSVFEL
jgi:hypothetical protein